MALRSRLHVSKDEVVADNGIVAANLVDPKVLPADEHRQVADALAGHSEGMLALEEVVLRDIVAAVWPPTLAQERAPRLALELALRAHDIPVDLGDDPWVLTVTAALPDAANPPAGSARVLPGNHVLQHDPEVRRLAGRLWADFAALLVVERKRGLVRVDAGDRGRIRGADEGGALARPSLEPSSIPDSTLQETKTTHRAEFLTSASTMGAGRPARRFMHQGQPCTRSGQLGKIGTGPQCAQVVVAV